jgi:hypothetical protein
MLRAEMDASGKEELVIAYAEPTKNEARRQVIQSAVRILTADRAKATLARRSYVREVRDFLRGKEHEGDRAVAGLLTNETISRWERFFDSIIQTRTPSDLKVAYLSGPNPENDLRVMCNAGVLPENIWAFESDARTYSEAVQSALASEFPFIKLVQGGIDGFLGVSPQRFDVIYLDFCGPIPSRDRKQKTLLAVTRLLSHHSLTSPGVLITNAALPTEEQDSVGRSLLGRLVAAYLYPKAFLENKANEGGFAEGAMANGFEFDKWLTEVGNNLDDYYGQYLTRMMMDHVGAISPASRVTLGQGVFTRLFSTPDSALNDALNHFFHFNQDALNADDAASDEPDDDINILKLGGDVITDPDNYPLLWTLAALSSQLGAGDSNYPNLSSDPEFKRFADTFLSQLSVDQDGLRLVRRLSAVTYLLSQGTGSEEFHSTSLQEVAAKHRFSEFYQFCDLLLFHQLKELLLRQWTVPYHVNVAETRRWKYKAKETPMFMDMLVLDECRYVYDWMPTVDMLLAGVRDEQRQLSFRFALDGVSKHGRWYSPEYFSGTAVIDQFTEPFEAKELSPRVEL